MIIRLTLDIENPKERVMRFLEDRGYLLSCPVQLDENKMDKETLSYKLNESKKYVEIISHLDNEEMQNIPLEDLLFIKQIILEAWNQFTNVEYERENFKVYISNVMIPRFGNGKDFYVFPGNYNSKAVVIY